MCGVGKSFTTYPNPSLDHMVDTVFPVDQLGTEYMVMSTPTRTSYDLLRITGDEKIVSEGKLLY